MSEQPGIEINKLLYLTKDGETVALPTLASHHQIAPRSNMKSLNVVFDLWGYLYRDPRQRKTGVVNGESPIIFQESSGLLGQLSVSKHRYKCCYPCFASNSFIRAHVFIYNLLIILVFWYNYPTPSFSSTPWRAVRTYRVIWR